MHSQPVHAFNIAEDGLSIPARNFKGTGGLEVNDTHYRIAIDLHGVPLKYVRFAATTRGLAVVGENILGPSDDFNGWLEGGAARFSSHIGLPEDADTDQVTAIERGDVLVVSIGRKSQIQTRMVPQLIIGSSN